MPGISLAPYVSSHRPGRAGQASATNVQLQGISIPWHLLATGIGNQFDLATGAAAILGTWAAEAADFFGVYDASAAEGSRIADDTADAASAGAGDVLFLPATEEDELDYTLIGQLAPFAGLEIVISTQGVGGVVAWEYLNNKGVWTAFPTPIFDESVGLTAAAGTVQVMWRLPEDWGAMEIAEVTSEEDDDVSIPRYWVRARVTTVFATNPVATTVKVFEMGTGVTLAPLAPAKGVIEYLQFFAGTASGATTDTIIQFINHTSMTRGLVTLTAALKQGRVALTQPFRVERGDVITATVLQEQGTTEFQDIELVPEITI